MKKILILLFCCFVSVQLWAQQTTRPPVWGIAKMTYLTSSQELAREYFGSFLGFEEAFSYPSDLGIIRSYKVNDRQFLEFVEDKDAKDKTRLISYSFETEDAEKMRQYLNSKGIKVPGATAVDKAGNEVFSVTDPSGVQVEFIKLLPGSLHRLSKGKYLSESRISKRIHHAGIYTKVVADNDHFYRDILGFIEMWSYTEPGSDQPKYVYLQIPDCTENIEYSTSNANASHPCFLVDDMQETVYTLKERGGPRMVSKPNIGKGNRWLLNLSNADKTRVEFTEGNTVR